MYNIYNSKIYDIKNKINKITNNIVKIIAVTKYQKYDTIKELENSDIDGYGESKVQTLIDKKSKNCFLKHDLHFIGHVQSNKIKKLINCNIKLIHSIDLLKTVNMISKYSEEINKVQNILIQVKFDNSINKFGVHINNLENFLLECSNKKFIKIKGLMYMPSNHTNNENKYLLYKHLYKEFIDIKQKKYNNTSMDILSMGTSHDFEIAVSCGSNMIRIGTEIFN